MSRLAALLAVGSAIAVALCGCSLAERHPTQTQLPSAQIVSDVCENGDGAVYAVTLGGVPTRLIAEKVVDDTTDADPIHAIAEQVVHNPDDAAPRDQLAEWVRTTCAGS